MTAYDAHNVWISDIMGETGNITVPTYRELKNQEARFAVSRKKGRQEFVNHPKFPGTILTGSGVSKQVKVSVGPRDRRVLAKTFPPSSFCSLARGLEEAATGGVVLVALLTPPPPRRGFAMRPKLRGDDATTFCAAKKKGQYGKRKLGPSTTYHELGPVAP